MSVVLSFPFMQFRFGGRAVTSHLTTGAVQLWRNGHPGLSVLVLLTSVAGPVAMAAALVLVCAPLRLGRRPPWIAPLCRLLGRLQPWSMMEVYLLGVIVAFVKLGQMADLVFGTAAYALFALILTLTAAVGAFVAHAVWARSERP
jgi:paraquat-inducible protein A